MRLGFFDFLSDDKDNEEESGIGLKMIIDYYNVKLSFNLNKCYILDIRSKNLYSVVVQGKFLLEELTK